MILLRGGLICVSKQGCLRYSVKITTIEHSRSLWR